MQDRLREHDREQVGVVKADQGDTGVKRGRTSEKQQTEHAGGQKKDADGIETAGGKVGENEGAGQAAHRSEQKINAGGIARFGQAQSELVHDNPRCGNIGADVYAHVADDADEAEQDGRIAQKRKAFFEGRGASGHFFFFDLFKRKRCRGNDALNQINGE